MKVVMRETERSRILSKGVSVSQPLLTGSLHTILGTSAARDI